MLFACLALISSVASAQDAASDADTPQGQAAFAEPPEADPALASPRATMRTFLAAMGRESSPDLDLASSCLELRGVLSSAEARSRVARRVHATLIESNVGLRPVMRVMTLASFPGAGDVAPGVTSRTVELDPVGGESEPLRITFIRNEAGAWLISSRTITRLEALYASLHPNPLERLARDWGMDWLISGSLLGMAYYLWVAIFAVILLGVIVDIVFREIVRLFTRRAMHRNDPKTDIKQQNVSARKAAKPFGLTAGGIAVYVLLGLLDLPAVAEGILRTGAKAFAMASAVWAAYRVVDVLSDHMLARAEKTSSGVDDLMIPLVRKAVKIFIVAFGLVFIAEAFALPITSLVAGLGIGGLAFAFAAKDTIENLFGSVAVILDRPFAPGDWVVVGDIEGTVEEMGFRSTRVRTFYNSLVTIPNATLVRATVDNYGLRRYRRFRTHLSLTYSTPPERIERFCEGIRELVRSHPHTRKDYFEIHLNQFSAASLDVLVYVFFRVPDWSTELSARHALMLDIIRLAQRTGVDFAFPTQTLHVFNETGSDPTGPSEVPPFDVERLREGGASDARDVTRR